MSFVLPTTDLAAASLRAEPLERLCALIEQHIAEDRYPGAQVALARHGKLAFAKRIRPRPHRHQHGDARTTRPGCSIPIPR